MRPSTHFQLFDAQADAIESTVPEILVGGDDGRCGASHLLRAAAIIIASSYRGARVLLLQHSSAELQRDHLEGPTGLLAMLADMERHGAVVKSKIEARFAGTGSTIRWSGCSRDAEAARLVEEDFDVLLVDRVEDVPEALYTRLRDRVMRSVGPLQRVIATTRRLSASGWVRQRWIDDGDLGRLFIELPPDQLDPSLVKVEREPTYREHLEKLHGGQFIFPPHIEAIVGDIDRWIAGVWDHVAFFVPSQHGKTEAGPRNAVPYILLRFPGDWCAITSYGAKIANSRSADARENFLRAGGQLKPGRRSVNEWLTIAGGGCWSGGAGLGVGGSATWLFGDDWNKDWADAVNATSQTKKNRWVTSTLRSRETMFSADMRPQKLCLTVTRWDPKDTAGHTLDKGHEAGERWGIRVLSAIKDQSILDGYREKYPGFEVLDDWREDGEPIWEDRRDRAAWEAVRIQRGPIIFDTECQQKPHGAEKGGLFEAGWFGRLDVDPAFDGERPNEQVYDSCVRAWDLAATAGAGDWTAGVKLARDMRGWIINRHTVRAQLAPVGVRMLIAAVSILDGNQVDVRLPEDPAAGGRAAADAIVRFLVEAWGWLDLRPPRVIVERPRKGKTATMSAKAARARDFQSVAAPPSEEIPGAVHYVAAPWSPALSDVVHDFEELARDHPELREMSRVSGLVAGDWWTPWLREVESFTGEDGRTDDQVDATVDAFDQVAPPRRKLQVF